MTISNILEIVKIMDNMSPSKTKWLFWTVVISSFFLGVDIDLIELISLFEKEDLVTLVMVLTIATGLWRIPEIIKALKK